MKKSILILAFIALCSTVNAQFIDKQYTQISVYADPVATHKENGLYIGAEITKVMYGFYASLSISHFEALNPNYTDIVSTMGVNFNLFHFDNVRYYAGLRTGVILREGPFGMFGGTAGFDFRISSHLAETQLHIGPRFYIDYREDQKNKFYGDSDGYERGVITNNPLLQENGAIVLTISWN